MQRLRIDEAPFYPLPEVATDTVGDRQGGWHGWWCGEGLELGEVSNLGQASQAWHRGKEST